MATAPVINRRPISADIIPPRFSVMVSRPSGDGWATEAEENRWEPVSMVEADGGDFSTLTLKMHLGSDPEFPLVLPNLHVDLARYIQAGSRIRLIDRTNKDKEWFVGYVGQDATLVQGSPQGESFQVSVYGPEWMMDRNVVSGALFLESTHEAQILFDDDVTFFTRSSFLRVSSFEAGLPPAIFNKGGLPNMSPFEGQVASVGSQAFSQDSIDEVFTVRVFIDPDKRAVRNGVAISQAETWTAYHALRYTVEAYDGYTTISAKETSWTAIKAVLGTTPIGVVSIDTLPVSQAIKAILGPLGYGFRLNVSSDGNWKHGLSVYPLVGTKAGKSPYLPPIGAAATDAQGSRGELSRLEFLRDSHNIRNHVAVSGGGALVQMKLQYENLTLNPDMFAAWSWNSNPIPLVDGKFSVAQLTNASTFINQYHTKGPSFHLYRDVYRVFVFNEDGAGLDYAEYEDSAIHDLSGYGLGLQASRRPIRHRLTRTPGTSDYEPPLIQMSVKTGGKTHTIDASSFIEVLKDRAGLRIMESQELFEADNNGNVAGWKPFEKLKGTGDGGARTASEESAAQLSYLTMLYNSLYATGSDELVLSVVGTLERSDTVQAVVERKKSSPLNMARFRLVRNPNIKKYIVRGDALGGEDTRDDSDAALAMAKDIQFADDSEVGHGSIMMHHLTQAYPPGSVIAQTSGRVLNLRLDGQRNNAAPVVRRTTHHFGQTNVTEVLLDSPLLRLT